MSLRFFSSVIQVAIFHCLVSSPFLSEARLDLTVTPNVIKVGVTTTLEARCIYKTEENEISALSAGQTMTSIVMSRTPDGDNNTSVGLAYLSNQNPTTATALPGGDMTSLSGNVSGDRVLTLTVSWNNPSEKEAGTFTCEATFVHAEGHTHVTSVDFHVILDESHLAHRYTMIMSEIKAQTEAAKDCCTALSQNMADVQNWKARTVMGVQRLLKHFGDEKRVKISSGHRGKVYVISKYPLGNANAAQGFCETFGGYLAEIEDADEWNFIQRFAKKNPVTVNFFLGGRDDITEKQWYWVTSGNPFNYTDWRYGEPNNAAFLEDCMEGIIGAAYHYQWNDVNCNLAIPALCEIDVFN